MSLLSSILLGLIQGVAEFLPISSSAHLVLLPYFRGMEYQGIAFDIMLHAATLLAVLLYFAKDWFVLIKNGLTKPFAPQGRMLWYLAAATVPAGLAGLFLKDTDEDIGLAGKNQLKMEATMKKPLEVKNREELKKVVSENNERYRNIIQNEGKTDDYYSKLNDDLEQKIDKLYEKEYNATGEEKQRLKTQIDNLMLQQDDVLDQWTNSGKNIAKVAQSEMTRTLKSLGYDSVILEEDVGSFGRKVKSYIVFDVKQLKQIK